MQPTRRLLLFAPLLVVVAGSGCAGVDTRGLKLRLDPLIGKADKEYIIEKYGEPVEKTRVDSHTDVWEFIASESGTLDSSRSAGIRTVTRMRVTFKDGVMASWTAYNAVR